jgi:pimeloyl-ACP methyl ester carboxylesterase/predicted glycosyltransferase
MRALEPAAHGIAINPDDGVRIAYEVFGAREAVRTIVFLPTWSILHSRVWKMQVPYFAQRGFRVIVFDGRGNGGSDRPARGYTTGHFARDTLCVLDTLAVERAVLVGYSAGARWGVQVAAEHPDRVEQLVVVGSAARLGGEPRRDLSEFLDEPPDREGWNKYTAHHWRSDYPDFASWFFGEIFSEPHSTRPIDEMLDWSTGTTPEILIATILESATPNMAELAAAVRCPTLIVHGADDRICPLANSEALHHAIRGSRLVIVEGGGHGVAVRDPIWFNETLYEFLAHAAPPERRWQRARARTTRRALYVSSPIGLGHAQRDAAIADELRALVPGLEIHWLAQHPVTTLLEARGECLHPLSARLAGESAHIEAEMRGEHELHVFQALRAMDEILCANFGVFLDAARAGNYDLWIGDEAWDVDYYLHENPELKTAPFAWLTDFVGYLPAADDPTGREAFLTADYNAEMIAQVERFPRVRDVALFVGNPDDIVPARFGPHLPCIRDWTQRHFDFSGYIRYFGPTALADRTTLRARYNVHADERLVVAAVGGSAVGAGLLRRVVDAWDGARQALPDTRLIVVCGPRIDPASLPARLGVTYLGYVHNLYELFAASDAAIVQGGLSTTMELVALGIPFLYVPLRHHFEQNIHVAYRLERYGVPAWARLTLADATPDGIVQQLARLLRAPVPYRPVEAGGARRAAERIATLL